MMRFRSHSGYAFLVSVLVMGAVASTVALSQLLLGWAAQQNGFFLVQSYQAVEHARTCAESALLSLRQDPTYGGEQTFTLYQGSCTIRYVGGTGNYNRTVCVQGASGPAVRKLEMNIYQIFPTTRLSSWQEVSTFSLCP